MKRIFFFATPEDIIPVLRRFEANTPIKFVQTGILPTADRPIHLEASAIPQPGLSTHPTGGSSTTYMVSRRETKNLLHSFVGDSGRRLWALRNGDNEDTVLLTLSGLWTTGTLLPGNMCTLHQTEMAQQLMRWFLSALKQEGFAKIDLWWVESGRHASSRETPRDRRRAIATRVRSQAARNRSQRRWRGSDQLVTSATFHKPWGRRGRVRSHPLEHAAEH